MPTQPEGAKLEQPPHAEIDHDLMMLQSLAALDRPEVADDAVMAVAHPRQTAIFEMPHAVSMHRRAIPSILDL
jgi:hypothetical protein